MHQSNQSIPLLLCMVFTMALTANLNAVLTAERVVSDHRYQIHEEALEANSRLIQELIDRQNQNSWDIFALQSQNTIPAFEPYDIDLDEDLQLYAYYSALHAGIDPAIVFDIMYHESRFQVDAVGHNCNGTRDHGLMQINDVNVDWLAHEGIDVHNPYGNIAGGIRILSMHMEKYPLDKAVAAYAAGPTGMLRGDGDWYAELILGGD